MKPAILVTGGAGYIGAHMVKMLHRKGIPAVVIDNLCGGHPNKIIGGTFIEGDIGDAALLERVFTEHRIDAVMHFAAHISVEESVRDPEKYFENNTHKTLRLLDAMAVHSVRDFIFSSTAAVFGEPRYLPIDETHPLEPVNPYGMSKYKVEQALPGYARTHGMRFGCLRYFNAAGADPESEVGPMHEPLSHLIDIALDVARGGRPGITVYGDDYPTPDGSCVRDYVHIQDLCAAHLLLLDYLRAGGEEHAFNLGTGDGYSVFEVIDCARRITGHPIPTSIGARRPGDPARLVADSQKARNLLGWVPARAELSTIIADAWAWEQRIDKPAPISKK